MRKMGINIFCCTTEALKNKIPTDKKNTKVTTKVDLPMFLKSSLPKPVHPFICKVLQFACPLQNKGTNKP